MRKLNTSLIGILEHFNNSKCSVMMNTGAQFSVSWWNSLSADVISNKKGYFSRTLSDGKTVRGILEREAMDLTESLEFFHPFKHGYPTKCSVDQQS